MLRKQIHNAVTSVAAITAVVGATAVIAIVGAAPAQAAGSVSCGGITCSTTSEISGSSSSSGGTGNSGGSGGSHSGGGSSGPALYTYTFQKCSGWLASKMVKDPADGSTYNGQGAYPNPDLMAQASWSCTIFKGGYSTISCPFVNGKAAYGVTWKFDINDPKGEPLSYWCSYPLSSYLTPTLTNYRVITGGEGQFVKVNSTSGASSYTANGVVTDKTGYRKTGYQYGNPATFNASLNVQFAAKTGTTGVNPKQPLYGYYSLRWKRDYALWQKKSWQGWMGAKDSYSFKGTTSDNSAEPFTYSCSLNPAMVRGIRTGVSFTPADCAKQQRKWQCSPTSAPKIMGTSKNVTVMRDGNDVPVVRGNMVADGSGIRNIRERKEFNSIVTSGDTAVSPLNGSDPNGSKQYFKSDNWQWNTWTAYNPNSKGTLHFYWSSDNGKSWKYSTKYHFTADFLVPVQGSIGGASTSQWVTDQADCGSVTSNTVTVVRSANG